MKTFEIIIKQTPDELIVNKIQLTDSLAKYSINNYYINGKIKRVGTPYEASKFIYLKSGEGLFKITMPFKVMDAELAAKLQYFRSFSSAKPYIGTEEGRKRLTSCIQHFLLAEPDFKKFKIICAKYKWSLVEQHVDLPDIRKRIDDFRKECAGYIDKINNLLKSAVCTEEDLKNSLNLLQKILDNKPQTSYNKIMLLLRAAYESVEHTDEIFLDLLKEEIDKILKPVELFEYNKLSNLLVNSHKKQRSVIDDFVSESLKTHLYILSEAFPVLKNITVINNTELKVLSEKGSVTVK